MLPWSSRQSASFAAQGARARLGIFADHKEPATFEGKPLCLVRTSIDHRREIEAGPFEQMPECTARVCMGAYPWFLPDEATAAAAVGKPITVSGRPLKIVSARRVALAGEIVLTLGKL